MSASKVSQYGVATKAKAGPRLKVGYQPVLVRSKK
jgi:hypothetical protein